MTNTQAQTNSNSKSENFIALLSLLGILVFLLLRYALDVGHEVYTL